MAAEDCFVSLYRACSSLQFKSHMTEKLCSLLVDDGHLSFSFCIGEIITNTRSGDIFLREKFSNWLAKGMTKSEKIQIECMYLIMMFVQKYGQLVENDCHIVLPILFELTKHEKISLKSIAWECFCKCRRHFMHHVLGKYSSKISEGKKEIEKVEKRLEIRSTQPYYQFN
jgi:hypothetical protein